MGYFAAYPQNAPQSLAERDAATSERVQAANRKERSLTGLQDELDSRTQPAPDPNTCPQCHQLMQTATFGARLDSPTTTIAYCPHCGYTPSAGVKVVTPLTIAATPPCSHSDMQETLIIDDPPYKESTLLHCPTCGYVADEIRPVAP